MNEEEALAQFKEQFVQKYIHVSLDRLLDLKNAIQNAESMSEVDRLASAETNYLATWVAGVKGGGDAEEEPEAAAEQEDTTPEQPA